MLDGDATGRWFISKARRSNKPIKTWTTSSLKKIPQGEYVDVQDDVLLGDVRKVGRSRDVCNWFRAYLVPLMLRSSETFFAHVPSTRVQWKCRAKVI